MTPITEPTSADLLDIQTIFGYVNTASGGVFWAIMLAVIWVIGFVGVMANGRSASRAWTFSSFICMVMGIILGLMGWVAQSYVLFLVLMTAIGLGWMHLGNANDN